MDKRERERERERKIERSHIQSEKMKFVAYVKGCTKVDKIGNEAIRLDLNFSQSSFAYH